MKYLPTELKTARPQDDAHTMNILNIKRIAFVFGCLLVNYLALHQPLNAQTKSEQPDVIAARQASDSASVEGLQKIIATTQKEATETNGFDAYLRLGLFQSWLCEAAEARKNETLVKHAATDGIAAAEKAAALNPKSSEAHQLLGDLLGRLIPHVFGGGMRYGKRSADEMDKAIQLEWSHVTHSSSARHACHAAALCRGGNATYKQSSIHPNNRCRAGDVARAHRHFLHHRWLPAGVCSVSGLANGRPHQQSKRNPDAPCSRSLHAIVSDAENSLSY